MEALKHPDNNQLNFRPQGELFRKKLVLFRLYLHLAPSDVHLAFREP